MRKKYILFICLFLFTLLLGSCNPLKSQLSYTISGIVEDASGIGIGGVTISFSGNFGSVTTSTNGAWSKQGLIGAVTVTPNKTDLTFNPVNVQVTQTTNTVNFIASEVICTSPYTVSGTINDSNGTPIAGVNINFGEYGYAKTAVDGTWSKTNMLGKVIVIPDSLFWDFNPASIELTGPADDVNFIASEKQVIFADANLEAAVREAIDKPTGDLYPKDMDSITELSCAAKHISNLSGIEYLINLEAFDAIFNRISDLTPLQYLTKLKNLYLWGNNLTDISPLSELLNLYSLDLKDNDISSITPLTKLTELSSLSLSRNQISDFTPILSMRSIRFLRIDNNPSGSLDALFEGMLQLHSFWVSPDQLSDFNKLTILPELVFLAIEGNDTSKLTEISFVSNLTQLQYFYLYNNHISDIKPLVNLPFLHSLILHNCDLSNITQLNTLANLATLALRSNSIIDITPLAGLTNLTSLDLSDNQISDLSPLENLNNISILHLDRNQINDILPLVNNQGISTGDYINLAYNNLDTSDPNSDAIQNINILLNRGVSVYYANQFISDSEKPTDLDELFKLKMQQSRLTSDWGFGE